MVQGRDALSHIISSFHLCRPRECVYFKSIDADRSELLKCFRAQPHTDKAQARTLSRTGNIWSRDGATVDQPNSFRSDISRRDIFQVARIAFS